MKEVRYYFGKVGPKSGLIPKQGSKDARETHGRSLAWRLFARRLTHHPFVKAEVVKRDGLACAWCGRLLRPNWVLHHVDYDHECVRVEIINMHRPTPNRPNRISEMPNCKACAGDTPDGFRQCLGRVVAVCQACNLEIAEQSVSQWSP
jgi:hypothetical protein